MGNNRVIQENKNDSLDYSNALKADCANTIVEFGEQFQILQRLYDEFGLDYPEECHTNYRDSWFHYRKLYNKKDIISTSNEKYGLEEHLLRAIKDAQICFLQQIGQWLEVWYHHREFLCDYSGLQMNQSLFDSMGTNWVKSLWESSGKNEKIFADACVYWYKQNIYSAELGRQLQTLIHNLKNLILDLRLGGMNIFRPLDNIEYVRRSVALYEEICFSLKNSGMLYLLPVTSLIYRNCSLDASLQGW
ncbi:MAG: hypothetical protein K2J99_15520 [Lachnospiraceae bacterium]|nr:hypothetical protein [Lachnospiraceae bacterium]